MLYMYVATGLGVDLPSLCDLDALVPVEPQPELLLLERGECISNSIATSLQTTIN